VTTRLITSGVEQARRLKEEHGMEVRASGRVINVDPHAGVIIRLLYAFLVVPGF
jgi:hypothetical protein